MSAPIVERLRRSVDNHDGTTCRPSRRELDAADTIDTLLEALKGAMDILGRAESNASGMGAEWDYVGPRVAACRAALAKAGVA